MDQIVKRILELSDPETALKKKVQVQQNELTINGSRFQFTKPLIISVGKASVKMANFFITRLISYEAIIVKPKGDPSKPVGKALVMESSHPYPDESSFRAGQVVREALISLDYDLVIFLLSGGASSLLEDPVYSPEVYVDVMKRLVTSGLTIEEINVVRKHMSGVKGGRLGALSKSKVVTLVISDVPGNDLDVVGSGPTLPDPSTVEDARAILEKIGMSVPKLEETPKDLPNVSSYLIMDIREVLSPLANELGGGILSSEVRGEAKFLGAFLASIINTQGIFKMPYTLLLGGEPEVTITGERGKGGRNGEVCLSFLEWVRAPRFKLYAIATDGVDGNSEYAGCIVDETFKIPRRRIEAALRHHSSYELLEQIGATVKTGPTGTNVNNVYVLMAP
ncbi:glycerate 2-kinase [Metallosphaera hakonensis]|uniref:Glycerate kinase n=1 Tax=Metallosphaera hakonensis JCM 8857 = DSM 7519 TaxID=1293036 RepID=A0A2U9IUF0_9CREN|nr:glycerate 2-kinase [Metallosphaera hakonensis]AWR99710.1 DUF4147 domain-containing protein [Metallosphaera hakonensis JCM 8857 = DSM 7519]